MDWLFFRNFSSPVYFSPSPNLATTKHLGMIAVSCGSGDGNSMIYVCFVRHSLPVTNIFIQAEIRPTDCDLSSSCKVWYDISPWSASKNPGINDYSISGPVLEKSKFYWITLPNYERRNGIRCNCIKRLDYHSVTVAFRPPESIIDSNGIAHWHTCNISWYGTSQSRTAVCGAHHTLLFVDGKVTI